MNTVPTTVATHDMNVARERDNSMNTVQPTVPIHERISPAYAILDNEDTNSTCKLRLDSAWGEC